LARYSITIEADSLPELIGAVTSAADLLQSGDARQAMVNEVVQLAVPAMIEQPPFPDGSYSPALAAPPEPDYVAAGLTQHQAIQARQAFSQPQVLQPQMVPAQMAGMHPVTQLQAQSAPPVYQPAQSAAEQRAQALPFCPIHQLEMVWKGGALSKNGKQMPLWSCPNKDCREAIWPPRA
jgi:hypothetical protein